MTGLPLISRLGFGPRRPLSEVFPLDEAPAAMVRLAAGRIVGKAVLIS
ncbi:hypothetical protein Ato02nite_066080 [Paractinoplanes toevensis]|uniref:Uncharacterized protein n=2 Tax=Paractinoplanes toevensis TaxID=571911 RepID=A0A919TFX8_9ACTN|nr:hypothetical protein Ato02nite_066080 [Actinoplanes toevensis]